jgi:hypothetical protein
MEYRAIIFSQHAFTRMFARGIAPQLVERAVELGEIIAEYPDDQPYPSILLLFKDAKHTLHVCSGRCGCWEQNLPHYHSLLA